MPMDEKIRLYLVGLLFAMFSAGCGKPMYETILVEGEVPPSFEEVAAEMAPLPFVSAYKRDLFVREMVLRYVMSSNNCDTIKVWFIDCSSETGLPSDFTNRFIDMTIPVKKLSQAKRYLPDGIWDAETGRRGAIAQAEIIQWIDTYTVEVKFSHYVGGTWAGGANKIIRYENGKWELLKIKDVWVS